MINNRIDLTKLKTYAIDDKSAEEVDDSISIEEINGKYRIWIHIVDIDSLVEYDSAMDKEAYLKASTVYLVEKSINMFPIHENTQLRGFTSGVNTNSLSTCIELKDNGEIESSNIYKSVVKTDYSLSYEEAQELIELAPQEEIDLYLLSQLMLIRRDYRRNKGAIIIEQAQGKFVESVESPKIVINEKIEARIVIEEMMILMGEVIANYATANEISIIYRIQDISKLPMRSNEIDSEIYESYIKRKLRRARLSARPMPHHTLGLRNYCQATSPIRRYSDLIVHRQIKAHIDGMEMLNINEIREYINTLEVRNNENNQIMNIEQNKCFRNWLVNNDKNIWQIRFIEYLKKNESLVNLRFINQHIDLICSIVNLKEHRLGDYLELKFLHTSFEEKYLVFQYC